MEKKNNCSITNVDIESIIDLQRSLSFAEQIASAVIGMMTHRDNPSYHSVPVLLNGGKNTGLFEILWETVDDKMKEYDKMKSDYEEMKRQLEVVRENDTKSL